MSERCIVTAVIRPMEGATARARAQLEELIPDVHAEPGCEFYALHESTDGALVFVEAWETRSLWVDHIDGPVVAQMNARLEGLLASPPEVHELIPAPAGHPIRGTLPRAS